MRSAPGVHRLRPPRARLHAALMIGATLAVSACGGSGASRLAAAARPTELYTLTLRGSAETPAGAPRGRGVAIIAFHGASEVCFRFAHLHGFTHATVAHIHAGTSGHAGPVLVALSVGTRFHHRGCLKVSPPVSRAIWHRPSAYYVNVHSRRYPAGAVRSQL